MIPESRRSSGGGNGNLLQYSCLENSIDGGAWQATVRGAAKSQTTTKHMRVCARARTHTHVNMWLTRFAIQQKLPQQSEATMGP